MRKRTKEKISYNMSRIKSKNTSIEKFIEGALCREGIKYKKNYNDAIGKPDFVILKEKVAIFCDSAFWHGYKKMSTKRHNFKSNKNFWIQKIKCNAKRDREVNKILQRDGWRVIRFWDFQIKESLDKCVEKIKQAIKEK